MLSYLSVRRGYETDRHIISRKTADCSEINVSFADQNLIYIYIIHL